MNFVTLPQIVKGQQLIACLTAEIDKITGMIDQLLNHNCNQLCVHIEMHNQDTCDDRQANMEQRLFCAIFGQAQEPTQKCVSFSITHLTDTDAVLFLNLALKSRKAHRKKVFEEIENLIIQNQIYLTHALQQTE